MNAKNMNNEEGKMIRCPKCSSLIEEPPSTLYQCPVCSSLFLGKTSKKSSSGTSTKSHVGSSRRKNTASNVPLKAKLIREATRETSGHLSPRKERSRDLMYSVGTPHYEPWNNFNPFVWQMEVSSDSLQNRTKDNSAGLSSDGGINYATSYAENTKESIESDGVCESSISFSFPESLRSSVISHAIIQKEQTSHSGRHLSISGSISDARKHNLMPAAVGIKNSNAKSGNNAIRKPSSVNQKDSKITQSICSLKAVDSSGAKPTLCEFNSTENYKQHLMSSMVSSLGEVRAHHVVARDEVIGHYSVNKPDRFNFDTSNQDQDEQSELSPDKHVMSTAAYMASHHCIVCVHEQYHLNKSQDAKGSKEHGSRNLLHLCKSSFKGSKMSRGYPPLPRNGGSPFVLCIKCNLILEVPANLSSHEGSVQQLRCGSCGKISKFKVLVQGNSTSLSSDI